MLASRHRSSGLNLRFNGDQLPFADYVANNLAMLAKVRAHEAHRDLQKEVTGNAPFELRPEGNFPSGRGKPYKRGVLLIHGLTDSPYFMRHLAEFFQQCGFRVMAILLPGHGTQPGDLLDVRWQEWARAAAYGVEQMDREADEIFLAGLSAGAALSIRHSLLDKRIRGLFLFSPALKITPLAAWANLHKTYSWLLPAKKWVSILPDLDSYKYESFPKNAAAQMYALTRNLRDRLHGHELDIPVFTAASADDATVDSSATLEFMSRLRHPCSRLVYYTTDPARCLPDLPEERVERISSIVPDQNIVSFSHLSIVLPPEDAHYGVKGGYASCQHYYPGEPEKYEVCRKNSQRVMQGEVTEQNLRAGILRRLMYNPHFAALKISMQRHIESLP